MWGQDTPGQISSSFDNHYENTPIQIYWKFYHQETKIFR